LTTNEFNSVYLKLDLLLGI